MLGEVLGCDGTDMGYRFRQGSTDAGVVAHVIPVTHA